MTISTPARTEPTSSRNAQVETSGIKPGRISQALHAGTMHKQLGAGPGELQPEDAAEPAHQEPEKKPGLFARIFGSK